VFQRCHPERRDFIIEAVGDNTSALSWIEYSGRRAKHSVANLAQFLTRMALCRPQTRLQGEHLAGILNGPADACFLDQQTSSRLGLRYRAAFGDTGGLSSLPRAARTVINDSFLAFQQADRGANRRRNDQTIESRSRHFASWMSFVTRAEPP
jgi:hypothetical protein